jgi:hypothetical protein
MKVRKSIQLNCCQVGDCAGCLCIDTRNFIDDMYLPIGFEVVNIPRKDGITFKCCCPHELAHENEHEEEGPYTKSVKHYYNEEGVMLFYYHVDVHTNCCTGEEFEVHIDYENEITSDIIIECREHFLKMIENQNGQLENIL